MRKTIYVVRIGGKLYVQTQLYSLYQATTSDILTAHFFTEQAQAEKTAKKAHGEVVELTLTDGEDNAEIECLKSELEAAKKEAEIAQAAFRKIIGKDAEGK